MMNMDYFSLLAIVSEWHGAQKAEISYLKFHLQESRAEVRRLQGVLRRHNIEDNGSRRSLPRLHDGGDAPGRLEQLLAPTLNYNRIRTSSDRERAAAAAADSQTANAPGPTPPGPSAPPAADDQAVPGPSAPPAADDQAAQPGPAQPGPSAPPKAPFEPGEGPVSEIFTIILIMLNTCLMFV